MVLIFIATSAKTFYGFEEKNIEDETSSHGGSYESIVFRSVSRIIQSQFTVVPPKRRYAIRINLIIDEMTPSVVQDGNQREWPLFMIHCLNTLWTSSLAYFVKFNVISHTAQCHLSRGYASRVTGMVKLSL
jgi:hypothetical protein